MGAAGISIRQSDLPLPRRGVAVAANTLSRSARLCRAKVSRVRDLGCRRRWCVPDGAGRGRMRLGLDQAYGEVRRAHLNSANRARGRDRLAGDAGQG